MKPDRSAQCVIGRNLAVESQAVPLRMTRGEKGERD